MCVADKHGNVYLTGSFDSGTLTIGSTSMNCNGSPDVFIVKYDSMGVIQWAKSAGGNGYDTPTGLGVDTAGNVYVTGNTNSFHMYFGSTMLVNANSNNTYDIFIAKYDTNGNFQWAKLAGTTSSDECRSIAVDPSGNSYITGVFPGTSIVFGTITLFNNYFLTKYDTNGNVVWAKGAGNNTANSYSVSVDGSENVYVSGIFNQSILIFSNDTLHNDTTNGSADIFVVKYDSSGTELWAKRAGGNHADVAYSIHADAAGNAFVTGYYLSPSFNFGNDTITNVDSIGTTADFFFLKFDASGNELWIHSAGSSSDDHGTSITSDPAGSIYVTGYYHGPDITFGNIVLSNVSVGSEIFVVKYDSTGNVVWAKSLEGLGNDYGSSIASDPQGDLYTAGEYASTNLSFLNFNLSHSGGMDMYVAKINYYNLTTSNADQTYPDETIFYPNPGDGIFYLKSGMQISQVEILDLLGKKVYETTISERDSRIDLSGFPAGVYFYKATDSGKSVLTGKVLIR
jgi:hypothetical protein